MRRTLPEVPENLRSVMKLHFAENMDQVLNIALERPLPQIVAPEETVQPIAPPVVTPPPTAEGPTAHQ